MNSVTSETYYFRDYFTFYKKEEKMTVNIF